MVTIQPEERDKDGDKYQELKQEIRDLQEKLRQAEMWRMKHEEDNKELMKMLQKACSNIVTQRQEKRQGSFIRQKGVRAKRGESLREARPERAPWLNQQENSEDSGTFSDVESVKQRTEERLEKRAKENHRVMNSDLKGSAKVVIHVKGSPFQTQLTREHRKKTQLQARDERDGCVT